MGYICSSILVSMVLQSSLGHVFYMQCQVTSPPCSGEYLPVCASNVWVFAGRRHSPALSQGIRGNPSEPIPPEAVEDLHRPVEQLCLAIRPALAKVYGVDVLGETVPHLVARGSSPRPAELTAKNHGKDGSNLCASLWILISRTHASVSCASC